MGLDFIIYIFFVTILIVLAVLAAKYYRALGAFGGLLGGIFTYICFTSEYLIINTVYDPGASAFVYQTYSLDFLAWVPLVLAALNFIIVLKD